MSIEKHPLGTVGDVGREPIAQLDKDLRGDLVLPDDDDYEDRRNVWNGLINKYPAIVVRAAGGADVARAVRFAREHGMELSVRSGAHGQAGTAVVNNGVVIDLGALDHISIDTETQVARVGPGTRAEDVLAETQEYGLAPPTGSAGDVGMAGTTLGGGIGWIRRKHGLSIDALRSVELVTADGTLRTVSPDHHEELFWAIRGGGGNFGIVTSFVFDLYEVGPIVGGLGVFYPAAHTAEVLETYREETADAPPELTTILLRGHVPPLPAMPEDLHGRDAVAVLGCYAGDPETGMGVIEPLRSVADPLIDMSEPMPYHVLHDLGTQLYPWGRNYVHRSVFLDSLSDEIHGLIAERAAEAPGEMDGLAVWAMGGNIGHGPPSAYAWADKPYMVTIEANWEHYDNDAEFEWVHETERLLREAGGEGAYSGFAGVDEQPWEDWADQVYGVNYDRLSRVKADYDPENVFTHNITIEPAAD